MSRSRLLLMVAVVGLVLATSVTDAFAKPSYALTVVSGTGDGSYTKNHDATITADTAPTGQSFDVWTGADSSEIANVNASSTTIHMPGNDTTVTATYVAPTYALTVVNGTGDGSYTEGAVVGIVADADPTGQAFDVWTGDTTGVTSTTSASTNFTVGTADETVTATYSYINYTLTVTSGTGGGTYTYQEVANIVADAAPTDYVFDVWTGDTSGIASTTSASTTLTLPAANQTCTATYVASGGGGTITFRDQDGSDPNYTAAVFDDTYLDTGGSTDHGSALTIDAQDTSGNPDKVILIAVADMFNSSVMGGEYNQIDVTSATLTLTRYAGDSGDTVSAQRCVTDWMVGTAGTNESNVDGTYSDVGSTTTWASGDWSASDLDATETATHVLAGDTNEKIILDVTNIVQDIYASGSNNGFVVRCDGTSQRLRIRASEQTTSSRDPSLQIVYTVGEVAYALTVVNGTGDGDYTEDEVANITADAAGTGQVFSAWTGDTTYVTSTTSASTTLTMPAAAQTVTATYSFTNYTLTVNSGTGDGSYTYNEVANIDADAAPTGQSFSAWTGDTGGIASTTSASTTLTMPAANQTITATYASDSYTLTVVSGTGDGSYTYQEVADIVADAPDTGQQFDAWTGDTSGIASTTSATTTLTMPAAAQTCTATYSDITYTLTVNNGTGDGSYTYNAVAGIDADAAPTGQQFDAWTGDTGGIASTTSASTTLTMPAAAQTVTATYSYISYTLTVTSGTGDGSYTYNEVANIDADAAPTGLVFDAWLGDTGGIASPTSASTTLTMPAASQTITATYASPTTYDLAVINGTGTGEYTQGAVVGITADAAGTDQAFDVWVGDTAGCASTTSASTNYTMPASNVVVTATYKSTITYTLTVVSGTGDGSYTATHVESITADAAPTGLQFSAWTGDTAGCASTVASPTNYTMPAANATVTATYSSPSTSTIRFRDQDGSDPNYTVTVFDDTYFDTGSSTGHGSSSTIDAQDSSGNPDKVILIAVKDMFDENVMGGTYDNITVVSATLTLTRYAGDADDTVSAQRCVTDWTAGTAGTNESNVDGEYSDVSGTTTWASGDWSSDDLDLTETATHVLAGTSNEKIILDVTNIVADIYSTGNNYGIAVRCDGTSQRLRIRASEQTNASRDPVLEIEYSVAGGATYALTVVSGTGDGDYTEYAVVGITADTAPTDYVFDVWTGDTSGIASTTSASTNLTMPATPQAVTATYTLQTYSLTVVNGSGDGDYTEGAVVGITADAPLTGRVFDVWTGDTSGIASTTSASTTLTIGTAAETCTATYAYIDYTLTVISGTGDGSTYTYQQVVAISADAAPIDYVFDEWVGDASGIDYIYNADANLTMSAADATVTATYADITGTFSLTVTSGTGDGDYTYQEVIPISADTAPTDFVFYRWNGDYDYLDDRFDADTNVVMPTRTTGVTAMYTPAIEYTLLLKDAVEAGYTDIEWDDALILNANDTVYGTGTNEEVDDGLDGQVVLTAIKDLFTVIPPTSGGNDIGIVDAKLHLRRYNNGSSSDTVYVNRVTTDWLYDTAGSSQLDVTFQHADKSGDVHWASGNFSTADYDTGETASSPWGSSYNEEVIVDVTNQIADIYADGNNYGLVLQVGSGDFIDMRMSENGTNSRKPYLEISYNYGEPVGVYTLTVVDGSGSGDYYEGQEVNISADTAPTGEAFNMWVGDIGNWVDGEAYIGDGNFADVTTADANYIMQSGDRTLIATYKTSGMPVTDFYPEFQWLASQTWGAEKDDLVYTYAGSTLALETGGDHEYKYASETSAFVAFETNLPATSYLEYGLTTSYGSTITHDEDLRFLHQYHITGLSNNQTYHYRLVVEDERENVVAGSDLTFATATPASVTYISGGTFTSAYTISAAGNYLLTGDVQADGVAFEITASDVTLDLGGHTVTYNNNDDNVAAGDLKDDAYTNGYQGVKSYNRHYVKVYNGIIIQGVGASSGTNNSYGASPIWLRSGEGTEVGGVTAKWVGESLQGFQDTDRVHHCTLIDGGNVIYNRHSGVLAIAGPELVHHTIIARIRQVGISTPDDGEYYDNEIYIDSWSANSYGIRCYDKDNMQAYGNRVFGTGYSSLGIAAISDSINCDINDNLIQMYAMEPTARNPEYGEKATAGGLNMRWHGTGLRHDNNVISVKLRDGGYGNAVLVCTYNQYIEPGGTIEVGDKFIISITDSDPNRSNGQTEIVVAATTDANAVAAQIVSAVNSSAQSRFQKLTAWNHLSKNRAVLDEAEDDIGGYCFKVSTTESDDSPADNQTITGKVYNDLSFTNNIFKLEATNGLSFEDGAVDVSGSWYDTTAPSILFANNTVISNICNVILGEDYGIGHNSLFIGNEFEKIGSRADYRTFHVGFGTDWNTTGHEFFDSTFSGGASYDELEFDGGAPDEFFVGWTLTVDTEAGATVTIDDSTSTEVFSGTADGNGICEVMLYEYVQNNPDKTYFTDHTVYVSLGGDSDNTTVTMDAKKTVYLPLP